MFSFLNSPVAPGGETIPNLSILHVAVSVGSPALGKAVGCCWWGCGVVARAAGQALI